MQNFSQYTTYRSLLAKKQGKGFSEAEAKDILQQALYQLTKFHDRNQAHGSISLDTVAYDSNQMQTVLIAGNGSSSPIYLAPEVLQTKQTTPTADIYALGIVIIVLITGLPPEALKSTNGKWNWEDRCLVSDQFIQILNIALNSTRDFRYVNAAQMLRALQDIINADSKTNTNISASVAPTLISSTPPNIYPVASPTAYPANSPLPQLNNFATTNVNPFSQNGTQTPEELIAVQTSQPEKQISQPKQSKIKKNIKIILVILISSVVTGGVAFAGYLYYQFKNNENTLQAIKQVSKSLNIESVSTYNQILDDRISNQLLLTAKSDYEKTGSLSKIEASVGTIALGSRVRVTAEELRKKLQSDLQQNNDLIKQAEKYYQEGKWQLAIDSTGKISATPYWQERKKKIVKDSQDRIAEAFVPQPSVAPASVDPAPVEPPSPSYEPYDNSPPPPPQLRGKRPLFGPGSY